MLLWLLCFNNVRLKKQACRLTFTLNVFPLFPTQSHQDILTAPPLYFISINTSCFYTFTKISSAICPEHTWTADIITVQHLKNNSRCFHSQTGTCRQTPFTWFRRHLFTLHQPSILTQFVYLSVFKFSQLIISTITAKRGANWASVWRSEIRVNTNQSAAPAHRLDLPFWSRQAVHSLSITTQPLRGQRGLDEPTNLLQSKAVSLRSDRKLVYKTYFHLQYWTCFNLKKEKKTDKQDVLLIISLHTVCICKHYSLFGNGLQTTWRTICGNNHWWPNYEGEVNTVHSKGQYESEKTCSKTWWPTLVQQRIRISAMWSIVLVLVTGQRTCFVFCFLLRWQHQCSILDFIKNNDYEV